MVAPSAASRKRARSESAVIKAVRAQCVDRDGYCRLSPDWRHSYPLVGPCHGPSTWAHLGHWRRCFTRGMAPTDRHHVEGSFMACQRHADAYDAHRFDVAYGPDGAQGSLSVVPYVKGAVYGRVA